MTGTQHRRITGILREVAGSLTPLTPSTWPPVAGDFAVLNGGEVLPEIARVEHEAPDRWRVFLTDGSAHVVAGP